jgi:hypothetical protein
MRYANPIKTLVPLLLILAPTALAGQTPPALGQTMPLSPTPAPWLDAIGLRVEAHDAVKLTLTLSNGQRLVLPVSALVLTNDTKPLSSK